VLRDDLLISAGIGNTSVFNSIFWQLSAAFTDTRQGTTAFRSCLARNSGGEFYGRMLVPWSAPLAHWYRIVESGYATTSNAPLVPAGSAVR
jgi:hypothetical protein